MTAHAHRIDPTDWDRLVDHTPPKPPNEFLDPPDLPHPPTRVELEDLFIASAEQAVRDRADRIADGHRSATFRRVRCERCQDSGVVRDGASDTGFDLCPVCEGGEGR